MVPPASQYTIESLSHDSRSSSTVQGYVTVTELRLAQQQPHHPRVFVGPRALPSTCARTVTCRVPLDCASNPNPNRVECPWTAHLTLIVSSAPGLRI